MAINLSKGQKIDLRKGGDSNFSSSGLTQFCVGVNWGAISGSYTLEQKKGGFLGIGGRIQKVTKHVTTPVDLDASCVLFDANNQIIETIYYKKLISNDDSIVHSGDDLEGDTDGDDGLDNEIISVNLKNVNQNVHKIVFFINSFKKQDFSAIPFSSIRIYEGTPSSIDKIIATYEITSDPKYKGFVSMVLGSLEKVNADWGFKAIGDPVSSQDLNETIEIIKQKYI